MEEYDKIDFYLDAGLKALQMKYPALTFVGNILPVINVFLILAFSGRFENKRKFKSEFSNY